MNVFAVAAPEKPPCTKVRDQFCVACPRNSRTTTGDRLSILHMGRSGDVEFYRAALAASAKAKTVERVKGISASGAEPTTQQSQRPSRFLTHSGRCASLKRSPRRALTAAMHN
jgi:hypothetical protein